MQRTEGDVDHAPRSFDAASSSSAPSSNSESASSAGAAVPAGSSRRPAVALRVVLVVFAALSGFVAVATPAWEANDEPDHVRNIELLARGDLYRIEPGAGYAPHQPPLYYTVLAAWQRVSFVRSRLPAPQQGDPVVTNGLFGHGQPQERDDKRLLLLLRLPSVLMGVLTVWLTSRVARKLADDPWIGVVAAATVAAVPKFVFASAFVNNDTMATALGATVTLMVVRAWRATGRPMHDMVWLGLAAGALTLTKLSTLPMIGVALAAVSIRRLTNGRSDAGRGRSWREVGTLSGAYGVLALPLFVTNWSRYGDPVAGSASVEYFRSWIPALVAVPRSFEWFGQTVASGFLTSFWYTSGWNQFRWRAVTYIPLWGLVVLALLGLFVGRRNVPSRAPVTLLMGLFLAACASVWILAWNTTQWQARIAFPGLAAMGALVALGARRWASVVRVPWPLLAMILPALGLLGTLYAIRTDVLGRY